MPHSSGGGSHRGGHHSGSHHSSSHRSSSRSGSRSSAAKRVGSKPFEGATRYMYFRKKQPVFVYSNFDITKRSKQAWVTRILILLFFVLPSVITLIAMLFITGHFPKRLQTNYDTQIYIDDQIGGVVKDPNMLMDSMTKFQKKTGITPSVVFCPNDAWENNYDSLEKYAYDLYVNRFDDEKHWLIVYSTESKEDGFEDWYWEGMQGDDTDPILDSKQVDKFGESLQKYLLQSNQYSVDQAIAQAFNELTPHVMDKYFAQPGAACGIIFELVFLGIMFLAMDFHPVRDNNYRHAQVCDPKFVDQEPCEYCGGIYIVGMHLSCPHCGAPVKPHDYYTYEEVSPQILQQPEQIIYPQQGQPAYPQQGQQMPPQNGQQNWQ